MYLIYSGFKTASEHCRTLGTSQSAHSGVEYSFPFLCGFRGLLRSYGLYALYGKKLHEVHILCSTEEITPYGVRMTLVCDYSLTLVL